MCAAAWLAPNRPGIPLEPHLHRNQLRRVTMALGAWAWEQLAPDCPNAAPLVGVLADPQTGIAMTEAKVDCQNRDTQAVCSRGTRGHAERCYAWNHIGWRNNNSCSPSWPNQPWGSGYVWRKSDGKTWRRSRPTPNMDSDAPIDEQQVFAGMAEGETPPRR